MKMLLSASIHSQWVHSDQRWFVVYTSTSFCCCYVV